MINCEDSIEHEAIERLKNGDPEGFEFLYNLHKKNVYNLCLRMINNRALAEELTQEAFLIVFRRIETFRGDARFGTWLHRIAINCVLMYSRERSSRIAETSLEEIETPEDNAPRDRFGRTDPALEHSVDRVALERAIAQLPPGYRLVLVLHDIEGYEHSEIAQLLGCSVGNTKSQLHKARLKLRRLLTADTVQPAQVQARSRPVPLAARELPQAA